MKYYLITFLLLLSIKSNSQVIAGIGVATMYVTDLSNNVVINELNLPLNGKYKLKIPIFNKSNTNQVPLGTCKIKIGLGSKLILDPAFNLLNSESGSYFNWTADFK